MSHTLAKPAVICLAGPTGAGKTAAALRLARSLRDTSPVQVINADSRQVYRDFPLITAQPSVEEQSVCPHHLYGFLESNEKISAGRYVDLALPLMERISSGDGLPVLVGGTGLYMRSMFQGLAPIPQVPVAIHEAVLQRVEEAGTQAMHAEVSRVDPDYAAKIHPNDRQRICRALEVLEATGKTLSWWHAQPEGPSAAGDRFRVLMLVLGLSLSELEPRLARRVDLMLEAGALDEARQAWERCSDPEAAAWTGIGCAEVLAHLRGEMSLDEARELWIRNTRAYAKRQITWFRREPAEWLRPDDLGAIEARVRAFLQDDQTDG